MATLARQIHTLESNSEEVVTKLAGRAVSLGLLTVIQSAASAASAKGGCASSRLDRGLKFYVIQGGCASSRLIHEFSDCA